MNKRPKPQATRIKIEGDLAAFEELPEKTKELMKLKEQQSKTIGSKQVVITREIEDTESQPQP